jgi:putative hydrolase of HD superfamily
MDQLLDMLLAANDLKVTPRSGWVLRGVPEAESVADHSYGVAVLALALAAAIEAEGPAGALGAPGDDAMAFDRGALLSMALLHDLAECRVGDLPRPARRYFAEGAKHAAEEAALADLLGDLPGSGELLATWQAYEAAASPEARLVRDADRLETLLQAYVYARRTGNRELAEFWDELPGPGGFAYPASAALYRALRDRYDRIDERASPQT